MKRSLFSYLGLASLVVASFAFIRADLAFSSGVDVSLTNLPYVYWVVGKLQSGVVMHEVGPLGPFALTERRLSLLLVVASMSLGVASLILSALARRANEPSHIYAGVAVLSVAVLGLGGRLFAWLEPWHRPF